MHTATGGTPACPERGRARRLAAQLADMIPGAATIRVSLTEPGSVWPQPYTVAKDALGHRLELNRTTSSTAARWVMRVWPEEDWSEPHTLDLATAELTAGARSAAERGR
ncbi:transcriptional regulator [Streptomyces sp. NPDC021020]|uniref:transcriptional regulator n=1 Tax=Streptomyces sp. NPDC021020 TaxID=3365109 RepID=UPI00378A63EE